MLGGVVCVLGVGLEGDLGRTERALDVEPEDLQGGRNDANQVSTRRTTNKELLRRERAGKKTDLDAHIVFPKNRLFPRIELLSLVDVLSARVAPHRERSHQTDDLLLVLVLELSTGDLGRVEVWSSQEPKRHRERGVSGRSSVLRLRSLEGDLPGGKYLLRTWMD